MIILPRRIQAREGGAKTLGSRKERVLTYLNIIKEHRTSKGYTERKFILDGWCSETLAFLRVYKLLPQCLQQKKDYTFSMRKPRIRLSHLHLAQMTNRSLYRDQDKYTTRPGNMVLTRRVRWRSRSCYLSG